MDQHSAAVKRQVTSTNEYQIMEFIKKKVHPIFRFLEKKNDQLQQATSAYFEELDPTLGIVYKKRREYDQSVTMLNKGISEFLELEEEKAQLIFPHYLKSTKLDGIAYNIYIGQSLLEKGQFKKLHLSNMRFGN